MWPPSRKVSNYHKKRGGRWHAGRGDKTFPCLLTYPPHLVCQPCAEKSRRPKKWSPTVPLMESKKNDSSNIKTLMKYHANAIGIPNLKSLHIGPFVISLD